MQNNELIRKAVELADGFGFMPGDPGCFYVQEPWDELSAVIEEPDQWLLDALAAQLVRQVDALGGHPSIAVYQRHTQVFTDSGFFKRKGPDRTLNTIKAIVDSGVLDEQKSS